MTPLVTAGPAPLGAETGAGELRAPTSGVRSSVVGTEHPRPPAARIALLGVGGVGTAFLRRLGHLHAVLGSGLDLAYVANSSRRVGAPEGIEPGEACTRLAASAHEADLATVAPALERAGAPAPRVVIDATASPDVAARHAEWLERGIHVVTASKLGNGELRSAYDAVVAAARAGGATYGDAATVGAGLPVLRSIRELRAGADEVLEIRGVLSGTLAWLFDAYQRARGLRPFSELVAEAHGLGLTEPDPTVDLSGADVRRKLVILARAAGAQLEPSDVPTESVGGAPGGTSAAALDAWVADRYAAAVAAGRVLAYVGHWTREGAYVGLADLAVDDQLLAGVGCDNRVVLRSTRYDRAPLVIQGPGAGCEVTAAALVDDLLRVARP